MKLAQLIGGDGFDDVTHVEFNDLIDTNSQALTDEDLAELTKSIEEETEDQKTHHKRKRVNSRMVG